MIHIEGIPTLAARLAKARKATPINDERGPYKLACMEILGGNRKVARSVELPSLAGWVYSKPFETETAGGDVHYLSDCNQGVLLRVAVADVMGHGQAVSSRAEELRELMHKHINTWDQSGLMRELNHSFDQGRTDKKYATVAVLSFDRRTGRVVYTNAGHPHPLWYHAGGKKWDLLSEHTPHSKPEVVGLPLGLIPDTDYSQTAVQLTPSDLLVLYTDGLTEAVDEAGEELGSERLLKLASTIPVDSPVAAGQALVAGVRSFRNGTPTRDDETLVVLQRVDN